MSAELYDELPYESFAFAHTHPWRMAVIGRAYGLATAAPRSARILELGCGTGWNAAAMAWALGESEVVAIDRSPRQVELAREHGRRLGLSEARFRVEVGDLLTIDPAALGTFDYVVAHGVYGWVPAAVNDRLMALGRACLRPGGLFYLSTNVYPGSALRDAARAMMRWRAGPDGTPLARATVGRDFLVRIGAAAREVEAWWSSGIGQEADVLAANTPSYAAHDHLAEDYAPVWFEELAAHAARHGLAYVADARTSAALGTTLPAACQAELWALARERTAALGDAGDRGRADALAFQSVLDFVTGRLFRRALFARADDAPRLAPDPRALLGTHLASAIDRDEDGVRRIEGREVVLGADADRALVVLRARAPETMPLPELARAIGMADEALAEALMEPWGQGVLEVLAEAPPIAGPAGDVLARPRLSHPARVELGLGRSEATNLYHVTLRLSELVRGVMPWLDGTRDRAALAAVVPEPERLDQVLTWLGAVGFFTR